MKTLDSEPDKDPNDPNFSYLENKGYRITTVQFQNLLAFLAIMHGDTVMNLVTVSPDYICEKYERYVGPVDLINTKDDYQWGLHPTVRSLFINAYHQRWGSMLNWTLSEKLDVL